MMGYGGAWSGGASSGTTAAIPGAPTATVTATEFAFSPSEITVASGEADLSLVNKGTVPHDLTIPALGVRIVAAPGQTTTAGLKDLPTGKYGAYCSIPGHADAGMRMTVIVQ
jgi:plastocyanin